MATAPYVSQQPVDDFGLRFSNLKYSANLAASTDTSATVPGNAPRYKAVIKAEAGGIVWAALNATAAIPAGSSFATTTSELIPVQGLCREVESGDVLHFFTATANTEVSIVYYPIGTNN